MVNNATYSLFDNLVENAKNHISFRVDLNQGDLWIGKHKMISNHQNKTKLPLFSDAQIPDDPWMKLKEWRSNYIRSVFTEKDRHKKEILDSPDPLTSLSEQEILNNDCRDQAAAKYEGGLLLLIASGLLSFPETETGWFCRFDEKNEHGPLILLKGWFNFENFEKNDSGAQEPEPVF